jgi:hypothetical protein
MNRYFRLFMFLVCALQLFFAAAFLLRLPFVIRLWPLPYTNQSSFIFIASIFAAAAAATLCCLITREYRGLAGIGLDYFTILTPLTLLMFQIAGGSQATALRTFGVICALGAAFGLGLFLWSRRIPLRDPRPTPRLVYGSFAFFVIALLIAGGQMVLKRPNILPWTVTPTSSIIYGWMFLGAAAYFAYGVLRPGWYNAAGQLAGFLAYDLVLIIPFLTQLATISEGRRLALIIYIIVVSYSGLLAIYYLFINPATRLWPARSLAVAAS